MMPNRMGANSAQSNRVIGKRRLSNASGSSITYYFFSLSLSVFFSRQFYVKHQTYVNGKLCCPVLAAWEMLVRLNNLYMFFYNAFLCLQIST